MVRTTRRILTGLAVLLALVMSLLAIVSPASAAEEVGLAIRSIDATKPGEVKVTFLYTGAPSDLNNMAIREEGAAQKIKTLETIRKAGEPTATVWVVDTSAAMAKDGALTKVKDALKKRAASLTGGDLMGLVSFNDGVVVQSNLTTSKDQLKEAIDEMNAPKDGHRAVWDAIRRSSLLFERTTLQPNMVLVAAGSDSASSNSKDTAGASLSSTGASLFVADIGHDGGVDSKSLQGLINRYGGDIVKASAVNDIEPVIQTVSQAIDSQYVVTYAADAKRSGGVDVSLSVGSQSTTSSYVAGGKAVGGATAVSTTTSKPFGPDFLRGSTGVVIILLLVGMAMALGVFSVASLATDKDDGLSAILRPYEEGGAAPDAEGDHGLAQTALLQRAVEMTEEFAERQGFLEKVERLLERADLPLRAAEALFFYGAAVVLLGIGGFFMGGLMGGLMVMFFAAIIPAAGVNFVAGRRQKAFNSLLPDTLHLLSGSLRAGYSLMQGVEAVSQEVEEPMGKELRRVVTEARLGREVEDSLQAVGERMESADFEWVVMAIRIQREVGGNLSELLLTVADTMIHRDRLRRDIAGLTAEGKISAIILGLLPVGLGIFMYMANPDYMQPLFSTGLGKGFLAAAVISASVGFAWMKKIINIEI